MVDSTHCLNTGSDGPKLDLQRAGSVPDCPPYLRSQVRSQVRVPGSLAAVRRAARYTGTPPTKSGGRTCTLPRARHCTRVRGSTFRRRYGAPYLGAAEEMLEECWRKCWRKMLKENVERE